MIDCQLHKDHSGHLKHMPALFQEGSGPLQDCRNGMVHTSTTRRIEKREWTKRLELIRTPKGMSV